MREDFIYVKIADKNTENPYFSIYYPTNDGTEIDIENKIKYCVTDAYDEDWKYFDTLADCIIYIFDEFNKYLKRIEYFTKE
jgi:hypothetical protein